jgi:hypothetical protein
MAASLHHFIPASTLEAGPAVQTVAACSACRLPRSLLHGPAVVSPSAYSLGWKVPVKGFVAQCWALPSLASWCTTLIRLAGRTLSIDCAAFLSYPSPGLALQSAFNNAVAGLKGNHISLAHVKLVGSTGHVQLVGNETSVPQPSCPWVDDLSGLENPSCDVVTQSALRNDPFYSSRCPYRRGCRPGIGLAAN